MFRRSRIQRIGQALLFGFAEVVNKEVASHSRDPSHEGPTIYIVRVERAIHLDENLLRQVLSIIWRSGKAITDVVDSPMITLDDLLPSGCVAGNAATDQQSSHLGIFQVLLPGNSCGWDFSRQPSAFRKTALAALSLFA